MPTILCLSFPFSSSSFCLRSSTSRFRISSSLFLHSSAYSFHTSSFVSCSLMRPLLSSLALRVKILFRHRYLDSSQTSHSLTDHAPPLRRSAHLFYVRRHSQQPSHYKSLTCKEGPERYPKPGIPNLLPLYIHSIVESRGTSWDSR